MGTSIATFRDAWRHGGNDKLGGTAARRQGSTVAGRRGGAHLIPERANFSARSRVDVLATLRNAMP